MKLSFISFIVCASCVISVSARLKNPDPVPIKPHPLATLVCRALSRTPNSDEQFIKECIDTMSAVMINYAPMFGSVAGGSINGSKYEIDNDNNNNNDNNNMFQLVNSTVGGDLHYHNVHINLNLNFNQPNVKYRVGNKHASGANAKR